MRKAFLQLHIAVFLWGFTGIFGKLILLNESLLVWYRMLIAPIALWLVLKWNNAFTLPSPAVIRRAALIGVIVCMHWITFYGAIKASNVSVAVSCFSSLAFFTAVMEPLMNNKKLHLPEVLLGLFVMAGIFMIFSAQEFFFKGIVLALISAILASLFSILNKKLYYDNDPGVISFLELASGFLFLSLVLPFSLSIKGEPFLFPTFSDWIYLLLLSVICTSFAFTLGNYALQKLDAFTCNLTVNLEPVYSIVLAILLFRENKQLNAGFYTGTAIILLSVVVHTLYKFKKNKTKTVSG